MAMTKEEYGRNMSVILTNIANDKKCFNMERKEFTSHHEASAYLREELEEVEEEAKKLKTDFDMYWYMCKNEKRCVQSDYRRQLQFVADRCRKLTEEVFDTWAVVLKALEQMEEWQE